MKTTLNERERFVLLMARAIRRYWAVDSTFNTQLVSAIQAAVILANHGETVEVKSK